MGEEQIMKVITHMKASFDTVEVELSDWRGTPINQGDTIVYATGTGSSHDLVEAEVLEVIPCDNHWAYHAQRLDEDMSKNGYDEDKYKKMKYYLSLSYKVKVRRTAMPGGFSSWSDKDRTIRLANVDRLVVMN
jgi:hypothetical protein